MAVEFRDERWNNDEIFDLLRELGAIYVNVDSPKQKLTAHATSKTAYFRMHGRKEWYKYDYTDDEMKELADKVRSLEDDVNPAYILFNNDVNAYGVENARKVREFLK